MTPQFAKIPEWVDVDPQTFAREILPLGKPAVLRGAVKGWPAVKESREGPPALCDYVKKFDLGRPADIYVAEPAVHGRFFYRDDMRGFNFERRKQTIGAALDAILAESMAAEPRAIYLQSTPIADHMPAFGRANILPLLHPSIGPRIWIGTPLVVAAHYDTSDNIACVVAGRRRFTLFPPDQFPNMYVGPLDSTPAGTPVSMVNIEDPDLERYPRFAEAVATGQSAELGPGDAIFIPYMWWHHVRSLERFNVLVNYWWNDARPPLASPYDCLLHALLALRDLPENQRAAWRTVFDYYVFQTSGDPVAHLAPEHR
ncbi:MAG TPA: cupin-like domain-containing protein, partial [Rhizomicrobium sp.]